MFLRENLVLIFLRICNVMSIGRVCVLNQVGTDWENVSLLEDILVVDNTMEGRSDKLHILDMHIT